MSTNPKFAELKRQTDKVRFNFIAVELDLAATFYERAVSATDEDTANRNMGNAVRAYQSALTALGRRSLGRHRGEIAAKLAAVAKMLEERRSSFERRATEP